MNHVLGISIGVAIAALYIAAITFALVQIYREADLNEIEKAIWFVAVLCAPVVGSLVWYAAGPHPFGLRVNSDLRRK